MMHYFSIQGTHYTLLATFEVLGKLAFASLSGWMIDRVGLPSCFVGFVMLAVLCVPASHLIPKTVTDERKNS